MGGRVHEGLFLTGLIINNVGRFKHKFKDKHDDLVKSHAAILSS